MSEDVKNCTNCLVEKPIYMFSLRSAVLKTRHSICKECHKDRARKHYLDNKDKALTNAKNWQVSNKEKRKEIANKHARKKNREHKQKAVEYMGNVCFDCKEQFPNCCYDFHHLDPRQKDLHLSIALTAKGFDYCKEELDKCVMLCASCHRIRHNAQE